MLCYKLPKVILRFEKKKKTKLFCKKLHLQLVARITAHNYNL